MASPPDLFLYNAVRELHATIVDGIECDVGIVVQIAFQRKLVSTDFSKFSGLTNAQKAGLFVTTICEEIKNDPERVFEGFLQVLSEAGFSSLCDLLSHLRKKRSKPRSKKRRNSFELPTLDPYEESSLDTGFESNKESSSPVKEKAPTQASASTPLESSVKFFQVASGACLPVAEDGPITFPTDNSGGVLRLQSSCTPIEDTSLDCAERIVPSIDSLTSLTQEKLIQDLQAKLEESEATVIKLKRQLQEEIERKDHLISENRRRSRDHSSVATTIGEVNELAIQEILDELRTSKDRINHLESELAAHSKVMETIHELKRRVAANENRLSQEKTEQSERISEEFRGSRDAAKCSCCSLC